MVYKLKPLELSFDFEDRTYELGDTIDILVNLTPNGDVSVREVRVDLVCEEIYSRNQRGIGMGIGGASSIAGGNIFKSTDYVSASTSVDQRRETYVHSTVVFLNNETLRSGESLAHRANLQIQPLSPAHLEEAMDLVRDADSSWTFKWTLVASVNVARGRDPKRQRKVKVKLPPAPGGN